MKTLLKSLFVVSAIAAVAGCSSQSTGWKRISANEIDQKSYAITYAGTAQTYEDRVNESYDIDSYMRGVDDWFNNKVSLPIEQIRGSLLNRMLDHNVYAYYSGVLDASSFQSKANSLSPKCWNLLHIPSATQGIHDAMLDLQKGKVRDDDYIKQGADQILHQCVESLETEKPKAETKKAKTKKKSAKKVKAAK